MSYEWNEYDEYFNNCNEWIIAMNERGGEMHEWNECINGMNAWMEWMHECNTDKCMTGLNVRMEKKDEWKEWWMEWMHESINIYEN